MAKQITLKNLQDVAQRTKQYIDDKGGAMVYRTETTLYSGGTVQAGDVIALSQDINNFDAIRIVVGATNGTWDSSLRNSLSQEYTVSEFKSSVAIQMPIIPRLDSQYNVILALRLGYNTDTSIIVRTIEEEKTATAPNYTVGIYGIYGINYVPMENYSTTEQVVGTWIDGKPLYQRTFVANTATTPGDEVYIPIGANIDMGFVSEGFMSDGAGGFVPVEFSCNRAFDSYIRATVYNKDATAPDQSPNTIMLLNTFTYWADKPCYITIKYTKASS